MSSSLLLVADPEVIGRACRDALPEELECPCVVAVLSAWRFSSYISLALGVSLMKRCARRVGPGSVDGCS